MLEDLAQAGFTRFSFGMQSAREHVLEALDRQHTPGQVREVTRWARELGVDYSLDLIYGAPGESMEDWRASLDAAIELEPGHISAYGLTIEQGTKMGARLRRGEIAEPDPDLLAAKYELADDVLARAGYTWYEVSNWAKPGKESQHNRAYWTNSNWWGFGPGAHSHIAGQRMWNVKHPVAYAGKLAAGTLPIAGLETLTAVELREEDIMLGIRLREGIPVGNTPTDVVAGLIADELIDAAAALSGRIKLTRRGRLLADTVIRTLWEAEETS
ncbi:coproporphyrinogen-III oxidase family protein [Trueperella pyogenes]|uniref:coproporphyrinogen-III oxidase family protein n=1 Tax=Trueperella pyogenes TaxID=1661 RepID=UPI0032520C3B